MGLRGPKSSAELSVIHAHGRANVPPYPPQPPPKHLRASIKEWWKEVSANRNFNTHQYNILQAAAESWERYQQAREALKKHGLSYTDNKGMIRARPEVAIERDSRTAFLRALRELKLDDPLSPTAPQLQPRALFER